MKKIKLFAIAFTVIAAFSIFWSISAGAAWDGYSKASSYSSGKGIKTDPYIIKTPEELAKLAADCNGGNNLKGMYFTLGADIDLGDKNWNPIGNNADKGFAGSLTVQGIPSAV